MIPRAVRLPLLFAVVALACVILVGSVSFEGALDAAAHGQTSMLESLARHIAEDLPAHVVSDNKAQLTRRLDRHTLDTFMISVRDEQGTIIAAAPNNSTTTGTILALPAAIGSGRRHRHNLTDEGPLFVVTGVPTTRHTVTVAYYPPRNTLKMYLQTLLVPLLISSAMVLWLATWVGIAFTQHLTMLDQQKLELQRLALHDPLTHLPNRLLFDDRLAQALDLARRDNSPLAIGILDLDGFKSVNDALGHKRGDQLLSDMSTRATKVIRAIDTFARLGGDEFALLMPAADPESARQVTERVLEAIEEELASERGALRISASIGIAIFPRDATDADGLVRKADQAMYEAKRSRVGIAFAV